VTAGAFGRETTEAPATAADGDWDLIVEDLKALATRLGC
jgi:hypothetical protein